MEATDNHSTADQTTQSSVISEYHVVLGWCCSCLKNLQLGISSHLVGMEVLDLQELIAIFCHFWDQDVQLQVSHRKVAQVLDLNSTGQ
ncbi:hypothetical protein MHYP_G00296950 [Metynnis hypsauchen]